MSAGDNDEAGGTMRVHEEKSSVGVTLTDDNFSCYVPLYISRELKKRFGIHFFKKIKLGGKAAWRGTDLNWPGISL